MPVRRPNGLDDPVKRRPCLTCPWRKDVPPHGFPGGSICESLERMAAGEFPAAAMQCHNTPDGPQAQVCVGFAVRVGFDSVGLRLAALTGRYDPATVTADDVELWESVADLFHVHGKVAGCSRTTP
jgi:hypothetical protein